MVQAEVIERNKVNKLMKESSSPTEMKGHRCLSGCLMSLTKERDRKVTHLSDPAPKMNLPLTAKCPTSQDKQSSVIMAGWW